VRAAIAKRLAVICSLAMSNEDEAGKTAAKGSLSMFRHSPRVPLPPSHGLWQANAEYDSSCDGSQFSRNVKKPCAVCHTLPVLVRD